MKILFFGTPQFAVPILEELHKHHEIVAVVTQPDRPRGKKSIIIQSPVKKIAKMLGLDVFQPEKLCHKFIKCLKTPIDFVITAAYGQYLPMGILELGRKDALNIHVSLLPIYRGATPIQSAIIDGKKYSGVSIIRMTRKMDAGPIFKQKKVKIHPDIRYPEFERICSRMASKLILNIIKNYEHIRATEQDDSKATYCKKLSKIDGEINWQKDTAKKIYNKLRAFTPWPGIYTTFNGRKLSLTDCIPSRIKSSLKPGTVFQEGGKTLIQAKQGSIEILKLQIAGKKEVDIKSFLNGYPKLLGSKLPN